MLFPLHFLFFSYESRKHWNNKKYSWIAMEKCNCKTFSLLSAWLKCTIVSHRRQWESTLNKQTSKQKHIHCTVSSNVTSEVFSTYQELYSTLAFKRVGIAGCPFQYFTYCLIITVQEKNIRTKFCLLEAYLYKLQLGVIAQSSNWHRIHFLTESH